MAPAGLAAVSRCTGESDNGGDGYNNFGDRHLVRVPEFLQTLAKQAAAATPSASKQMWQYFSDDLKAVAKSAKPGARLSKEQMQLFYDDFNRMLMEGDKLYSDRVWPAAKLSWIEKKLAGRLTAGNIAEDDLKELNRRLLEKSFPKYIWKSPKDNRPPVLHVVQEEFGGGYSDGHIYLLEHEREMED